MFTDTNLWIIFLTGLFAGGLSCIAVQGGLLATSIAQQEQEELTARAKIRGSALPILAFLFAKIIAYTLLGLLLGWFGSVIQLSLPAKAISQALVALFMLGTAGALLNLHPFFQHFLIQPPKFLHKAIQKHSTDDSLFSSAILGAFTVLIPCGATQAMMALAITSGSPLIGAAILFAFTLGTSPLFFILGYLATRLGAIWHKTFLRIAAYGIIVLAVYSLNGAIALTGSSWTLDTGARGAYCLFAYCDDSFTAPVTQQVITIDSNGYTPNNFTVRANSEVTIKLVNKGSANCPQAFTMPQYNLQKIVPIGKSEQFTFKAPNASVKEISFMCSAGLYRGTIHVI